MASSMSFNQPSMPRAQISTSLPRAWSRDRWTGTAGTPAVPKPLLQAAVRLGGLLEIHFRSFVADFVMMSSAPQLVELNTISTLGRYPGMDPRLSSRR